MADERWALLDKLKMAVKKIKILINFNLNKWKLASIVGATSSGKRRLSFNDRPGLRACVDDEGPNDGSGSSGCRSLQRTMSYPSSSEDDIDKRAEAFIANFYKQLQYERQISLELRRPTSRHRRLDQAVDAFLFSAPATMSPHLTDTPFPAVRTPPLATSSPDLDTVLLQPDIRKALFAFLKDNLPVQCLKEGEIPVSAPPSTLVSDHSTVVGVSSLSTVQTTVLPVLAVDKAPPTSPPPVITLLDSRASASCFLEHSGDDRETPSDPLAGQGAYLVLLRSSSAHLVDVEGQLHQSTLFGS
ncbi:Unknown protein [Striga hermonthica]|uniref:Uncharacterized protein n=1 Tax=Striga hermonthica TaxID=68872 RepID=A0A9N7R887_STRHE|nr:Unknown protein [Striga hermonthica]